ncbi:quercetin dioxygenase-like cupin family protein [Rhizobium sp. PP-CC-3G-465]|nr:quercetin dioxygenase-like cupin family protein [Rhizobium sp. PP-WC-1G-195]TCP76079.1 quercetin dioxygenase-like cupin family protein [Rhizobium sp. PP-CC-2G-626]TCQ16195.1 quercetin dioxygenase-like cupin family protein [Rhizobium sp. PP-CC-3G-465]
MKLFATTAMIACTSFAGAFAQSPEISQATATSQATEIFPAGSRASARGPKANFTGSVVVDMLYRNNAHTANSGALVTFEPGARSAWHTHPAGQILIVTSGAGWVQEEGGEKRRIRPGDVIWMPPGTKHWHGATDKNGMSHIAVSNVKDGKAVDWMEKVTDEQYLD